MLLQMELLHSFLWLSSIPLYIYTTSSLSLNDYRFDQGDFLCKCHVLLNVPTCDYTGGPQFCSPWLGSGLQFSCLPFSRCTEDPCGRVVALCPSLS